MTAERIPDGYKRIPEVTYSDNIDSYEMYAKSGLKKGDRLRLSVCGQNTDDATFEFGLNQGYEGVRVKIGTRDIDLAWGDIQEMRKIQTDFTPKYADENSAGVSDHPCTPDRSTDG